MSRVPKKDKHPPRSSDPKLAELLEHADAVKRTSEDLVRQMQELAAQIAEAKAKAADAEWKWPPD